MTVWRFLLVNITDAGRCVIFKFLNAHNFNFLQLYLFVISIQVKLYMQMQIQNCKLQIIDFVCTNVLCLLIIDRYTLNWKGLWSV